MRPPAFSLLPRSLHLRLVLLFSIILVGAFAAYALYTAEEQGEFTAEILETQALSIAAHIAASTRHETGRPDRDALTQSLSKEAAFSTLETIAVVAADGQVLAAVRREANRQLVPDPAIQRHPIPEQVSNLSAGTTEVVSSGGIPTLVAWSPTTADGTSAWVRTEQSLGPVARLQNHIVADSIMVGASVMVLAMVALTLMLRRPMAALREATTFAARIDTDYGTVLTSSGGTDEVEQLRGALNWASIRLYDQQAALKASEKRSGAILEAALDCIVSIDAEGLITEFNPAAETTFGYRREEILGHDLAELIVPPRFRATHNAKVMAHLQSAGGTMLRRRIEHSAVRKDGEEFPVELAVLPVEVAGQKWFTAYIRDIGERRAAQQALAHSEQRYRSVVENLTEVVFQTDTTPCWIYLNPAWTRITQYPLDESVGKSVESFVLEEERDRLRAAIASVLAGEEESSRILMRVSALDGSSRWVDAHFQAERDGAGAIIGLAGSAVDITERKVTEERLRDQLRFVRQLIEVIPSPIYIQNKEGRYLGFNKAFAQFFGKRRRDFLGKTVFDLLPQASAELNHAQDARLLAEPGVVSFESQMADRSGHLKDALHHKATYSKADGSTAGIVGIITDISERKLFERELLATKDAAESANRAKSEFLANMSHEIRTPMNAIIGMTDLVLDSALDEEQREYLELVKSSADALLTIINDILDFSKIEAGRVDFENIAFNLRNCVNLAVRTLENRAREKGLDLRCDVDASIPEELVGDPHRLRQVLINLLGNAVKFTEDGSIVLTVARAGGPDGTLRFTVKDTGRGIARDKQQLIFDAFSQADASTTRRSGGTGLGLAISSRLVEGMGGIIWVESEPGLGSTFHFTARLGQIAIPSVSTREPSAPLPSPVRTLVVAASSVSRDHLENLMRGWQFESVAASGPVDGAIALALARSQERPVNIILIDNPADHDAFATAAALRQYAQSARIIVLTSAGLRGDAALCREHGISAYLVQPVPDHDLREAILLSLQGSAVSAGSGLITRHTLQERRQQLNVLVAEDHPVNRKLAVRLLGKLGHRSTLAKDGLEAIALSRRSDFDLILMDVQMPGADGPAATRSIRSAEMDSGRRTPIFALTAENSVEARERCLAAGMDGTLSKPLQLADLAATLENIAARKSAPISKSPDTTITGQVFDRAAVLENLGGDTEILEAIAGTFLAGYTSSVSDLQQAVACHDWQAAYRVAHSIKGAAGNFCADRVTQAALETEAAARAEDLPALLNGAAALEKEVHSLAAALQHDFATGLA
ncbi:MAG: PAS domain S-box protein, partial [Rhodocyclaceae bacterium]